MNQTENMDVHELDELVIPNCLLEVAELAENCDLNIQCVPGAIIIGSSDPLDTVPEPLMKLFKNLGISDDAVRSVLEGGLPDEQW